MERLKKRQDLYTVIIIAVITLIYFTYNNMTSENRGIQNYQNALKIYKETDYENAYQEFGKVPSTSCLKEPALFRQARCATNLGKKELAIKKYNRIVKSNSKSSIVPISEYNMANLLLALKDKRAKKHYKNIIKKYPTSDYAIASHYYLGLIEMDNLPQNENKLPEAKNRAFVYFKTYIEKTPDGRFALSSVDEILKLNIKLKNYDNLLIAKAYYYNGEYEKAKEFLNKTTLAESWLDFAKNEYKLKNYDKAYGLKEHSTTVEPEDIYQVIDNYISMSSSRKAGIGSLLKANYKSNGADYIDYLNCNEVVEKNYKEACFRTLYEKYPNGQFSAESLYNLFITKYLQKKIFRCSKAWFLALREIS